MAIPDISSLTQAELVTLIQTANSDYNALQQAAQATTQTTKQQITSALAALDTLIGEGTTTANQTNLVGMNLYTGAQMSSNAAIAFPLAFQSLLAIARDLRQIASVVGE